MFDDKENDWMTQLSRYFESRKLPEHMNASQRRRFRIHAQNYMKIDQVLYRRNHDGFLLRCVPSSKTTKLIKEFYSEMSKGHYSSYTTIGKIIQEGYY